LKHDADFYVKAQVINPPFASSNGGLCERM
jgi:hypothetical protein